LQAFVVLMFFITSAAARAADAMPAARDAPWRVVVLNGGDALIPFWLAIDPALREAIAQRAAPRRVEFFAESLDLARFPELAPDHAALLQQKYAMQPADLVMTVGTPALEFALRHRDRIWRSAPIVFLVVAPGEIADPSRLANVTGVYYALDVEGTLALMTRQQPQLSRLVVAGGGSAFDLALKRYVLARTGRLPHGVAVDDVNDRTPDELAAVLARQPPGTAVLYTSMMRGPAGAAHTPRDVAGVLAVTSSAPVYAIFPTMLGQGVVGGSMTLIEDEAGAAADLALRVLRAGSAEGIVPLPSPPSRCLLDFRALRRWDMGERAVPDGCEVRFVPPAIWRDYPLQAGGGLAAVTAFAALSAALLVQRRRRHQADLALQQLRATLFHASRLAAVGEMSASIAHEINQPLGAILTNADVARRIIERDPTRTADVKRILEDIRADDLRASAVIQRVRGLVTKREVEPRRVDLNELVTVVLALLRTEAARRDIALGSALDAAVPPVLADRVQLQQVLLNLTINAMDAMAETPALQRSISVSTSARQDGAVELAVADRGHGIAPENLPRLFESFWSTKPEGMGLGLAVVKSIVDAHGGSIQAQTNEHGGATFRVVLRAAPPAATGATDHPANAAAS
jgi:signal transduction histidine kinase